MGRPRQLTLQERLMRVKALLIDLSGTVHIDSTEIPGSIAALRRLRASGLKYKFVTNTSKESQNILLQRLQGLGFEVEHHEIFSSLVAAREYLRREQLRPHLLIEPEALEDFEDLKFEDVGVDDQMNLNHVGEAVVVGLAPSKFNYEVLNDAFRRLIGGAKLVAIHQGRYYKTLDGLSMGPGPFVRALAFGADIPYEAIAVVGKPQPGFFLSAMHSLDPTLKPDEVAVIGDDVHDDVDGAQALGMLGILVQTGKYRPGDENKIKPKPRLTAGSFAHVVDVILHNIAHRPQPQPQPELEPQPVLDSQPQQLDLSGIQAFP